MYNSIFKSNKGSAFIWVLTVLMGVSLMVIMTYKRIGFGIHIDTVREGKSHNETLFLDLRSSLVAPACGILELLDGDSNTNISIGQARADLSDNSMVSTAISQVTNGNAGFKIGDRYGYDLKISNMFFAAYDGNEEFLEIYKQGEKKGFFILDSNAGTFLASLNVIMKVTNSNEFPLILKYPVLIKVTDDGSIDYCRLLSNNSFRLCQQSKGSWNSADLTCSIDGGTSGGQQESKTCSVSNSCAVDPNFMMTSVNN